MVYVHQVSIGVTSGEGFGGWFEIGVQLLCEGRRPIIWDLGDAGGIQGPGRGSRQWGGLLQVWQAWSLCQVNCLLGKV